MVNYYIYATDDSGSTNGEYYFNSKGANTLKDFTNDVQRMQMGESDNKKDRIVYLHWSNRCIKVSRNEVVTRYAKRNGDGSDTLPHTVLDWFKDNLKFGDVIKLLYIITDGSVMPARIKPDPNMKIDNVMFYAFNSDVRDIDMSIASMFICDNKSYTVYCNEDLVDKADLSNPYNYDEINLKNFHKKKDELKSYIKLQFLTKKSSDGMALNEIRKLKLLRQRLYDEITSAEDTSESVVDLNVKDKQVFIRDFKRTPFYKTLMNPKQHDVKHSVEACISAMISYINNDKKSFEFDNLKFEQKFDTNAEVEDVPDVNYENVEEITFPDIIMYNDTGVPILLLTNYNLFETILFKNAGQTASFSKFRNAIECPLCLMFDDNFKDSIEYYYNLDAFKGMIDSGIRVGPRTRRDFTGAIVPLEEFDDYNDYVLACSYFNGRKVPHNKGLLYYVIWKTCEKLEYIEPSVVDYFKAYIVKRIAKTECYLGLSGVSIDDPLIWVNLTTALWYCVELSSILFKNDPVHFTKEKMRMYCNFTEYMKEILTWFQYSIDEKSVILREDIFKNLNRLKRISRPQDKALFILEQIFAKQNNFLVAEFAHADNIYKLNYLKMDHKKVVDESVLTADVNVVRLWTYQTCVEYGWYQTTSGTNQPFLSTVPLEYFHQMCKDFFSSYFNENLLRSGIDSTNLFFGGGHLPDRVVTVLGGQDPWTPMGPKPADAHHLAPVHLVPGISHCRAIIRQVIRPCFNENLLRSGIDRTNLFFGGGHLPDRVVTVLGGHDPWTPMGPKPADAHHLAPVHLVPGISHCRAIQGIGSSDDEELERVKDLAMMQLYEFVFGVDLIASGTSGIYPSIAILVAGIVYLLM